MTMSRAMTEGTAGPFRADVSGEDGAEASLFGGRRDTSLLCLLNICSGLQEPIRVLRPAVDPDLIMQMRPRGPAGGSHCADALAHRDPLADIHSLADPDNIAVVMMDGKIVADRRPEAARHPVPA